MNRRNFGDRSGVILDLCSPHGVWFDADELARVLDWVRAGGLRAARALAAEAARERPPAGIAPSAPFPEDDESIGAVGRGIRFLGAVLETLFDRLHRS